jgi:F-type H+-transporting ATPase subunit a
LFQNLFVYLKRCFIPVKVFILLFLIILPAQSVFSQSDEDLSQSPGVYPVEETDPGKLDIIDKVVDHHYIDLYFLGKIHLPHFEPFEIFGIPVDMSITKSLFMLFVASFLLIAVISIAARKNSKNRVPKGLGNLVEILVVFIRDEIVRPNLGKKEGDKLLPFFLTLFFFIMFANLLGLFPFMTQPTKNVNVTAGLALITFIITQIKGIQKNGFVGYFKGLVPAGIPIFVLPIMIVVEFIGLFTKPFSLLMRLFANITAGSIIILSLIGLIFIMEYAGGVIAIPFALFIYLLEIFIALLQAYIFTMLSVLYVNMAMHQEH